jgi:carboxypeptidase PM20D1
MGRTLKFCSRGLLALALGLLIVISVLLVRTARFRSRPIAVPAAEPVAVDVDRAAEHLGGAVRHATVSHREASEASLRPFLELHAFLRATFPLAAARLRWEPVNTASLLITWEGTDARLGPLLLLAHLDVVPAVPDEEDEPDETRGRDLPKGAAGGSEPAWEDRAFSGSEDRGFVWGRGTLDDKAGVVGVLEAVEALLREGHAPRRTVLLAFGHDEEVGGEQGARQIAAELQRRKVEPECILDEGSTVVEGVVPGLSRPVAAVGIAEKGFLDVALEVEAEGGHSSMPPPHTAIGILARAIERLEDQPFPAHLDGVAWQTLEALGPEFPFGTRLALANTWLFGPLVERQLAASPPMNALLRTTAAVTLARGGVRDNVLPRSARAIVNVRVLPGDTSRDVLDHVGRAVDDPRVKVGFADAKVFEASPVSPTDSAAYAALVTSIRQTFPDALVVPTLVIAGTDARHYQGLAGRIYRFLPVRLGPADLERIHGRDERIGRKEYADVVRFYYRLMKNFDRTGP